ncbi:competence/damage-inducible protein A [Legionella oakridgensis]|uniref:Nucleotide-utilizing enzyme related to molybdopterin-biosynthesis enzyme MoeA n=2 Tax=Legionella oakridgensis TaxID=29423 RepID=W0BDN7_9GAMM|nr:competence/damage-inducible protein A [Legionella oakridgensis]AHE66529.1 nucleotide-utilizing enzyme related to molybdopterin-biosynthesis enzyme MoeA [Legionella oakridgensis ATCC 33761 = DSM 21215]KTD37856.1 competence damage inducible protein CinA [Legionella oakridgensis]STY19691.1 Competence damage inducible protein CinA [Legionella longbeachae]
MNIAILATGDEIIYGDTLNTNGHAIAHLLCSEGFSLGLHLACGDSEVDIYSCLEFLGHNHDTVVVIGGLGPTSDDRTRFALARFLNAPLVEFPEALNHIQTRLNRANLSMNTGNHQQSLFPSHAILLPNPHGTAMGCICVQNNKQFILLPGPPRECLVMFNNHVLPELRHKKNYGKESKSWLRWRLFGVAEGEIAEILDNALADMHCETGYRIETPYVEFKVRCQEAQVSRIKEMIDPIVAPHIIASPEQKASEGLRKKIAMLEEPMVIIDDATGGVLQTLLQRPNTYQKLMFHENDKWRLHFHLRGLEEYWTGRQSATTHLIIKYHNDVEHGSETHQIPYRSPLIVDYAVEWLSFRLLHLIDQLH